LVFRGDTRKSEVVVHVTRSGGEIVKVVKKHATFSTIYLLDPQTEVKVQSI